LASVGGALSFIAFKFIYPAFFPETTVTGIVGQYRLDNLPEEVASKISQGLVRVDETGSLIPQIAVSWKSENNAQSWIMEVNLQVNPKELPMSLKGVKISYPTKNSLRFELQNSYVSFPYLLTKPLITKTGQVWGENRIVSVKTNRELVTNLLVEYKGGKRERFLFYPTNDLAFVALKMGRIDKLMNVGAIDQVQGFKNIRVTPVTINNQMVILFFNLQSKVLSSKEIRGALNYGLDKNSFGKKRALTTIYPKGVYYNPSVKKYDFDINKAKTILAENKAQIDTPLKIVTNPDLVGVAEKIRGDWEKLGLKAEVFVTTITPVSFDAYVTTFSVPFDPDQYPLWHSTQTDTNLSHYSNPRIDKLLEDGRVTENIESRKKLYFDFQRYFAEDCPAIPLYYLTRYNLERV